MKLNEVKIGETFKIANVEFVKFTDGEEVFAVTKDTLFNSFFRGDGNFAKSKIRTRIEAELLPKLEAEIGAENILEFETDRLAFDGTRPFPNFCSKVSLVTLDFYRQHRSVFEAHKSDFWWWLATPDSETYKDVILCVSPHGNINNNYYNNNNNGVRPYWREARQSRQWPKSMHRVKRTRNLSEWINKKELCCMTDFEKVIDFENMYKAYCESKNGKGFQKQRTKRPKVY